MSSSCLSRVQEAQRSKIYTMPFRDEAKNKKMRIKNNSCYNYTTSQGSNPLSLFSRIPLAQSQSLWNRRHHS